VGRLAFCAARLGNHSGRRVPVAWRIGAITRAISSGAASIIARIGASPSQFANAAPSSPTPGETALIQPNPRGRRSSAGTLPRATGPRAATPGARSGEVTVSPASIRRIAADSAANRATIQARAIARRAGETALSTGAEDIAAPRVRTTRRTTAFTRSSRVERNGAENMFWSFSERRAHLARRPATYDPNYLISQ
jgi:hypothetical protein